MPRVAETAKNGRIQHFLGEFSKQHEFSTSAVGKSSVTWYVLRNLNKDRHATKLLSPLKDDVWLDTRQKGDFDKSFL